MAATYTKVPRTVPSGQRSALITAVEVGDQVDVIDVLGRPARGMKMVTTASTDSVSYQLNHKLTLLKDDDRIGDVSTYTGTTVEFWASDSTHTFTDVGENIETVSGLRISSFEITSVTLGSGSTISVVVW